MRAHRVMPSRHYRILHRRIDGGALTRHNPFMNATRRTFIGTVARSMTRLLKFRYLLLGGATTGGVAATRVSIIDVFIY